MKTPNFKPYLFCIIFFITFGNESFSQTIIVGTTAGQGNATATGGSSYTIPIDVLKGTNGMEPKINLSYNSQSGEGIAGFGWSLSAYSSISRSGKRAYYDGKNTPVSYTNDNDAFLLDGQRLFPITGNNGADGTLYGTENETFAKIESFGGTVSSGPDRFEVTTRDGMILDYGLDATSKVLTDNGQSVMFWLLKRVTDKNKNFQEYKYSISQTDRDFALTEIDYTGNKNTGMAPYNKIQFTYSVLPYWQNRKVFEGGTSIASPFLLDKINIINADDVTVKNYQCSYTTVKNQSFLSSFTETGSDGSELNPLTFQYGSNTIAPDVTVSTQYSGFKGNHTFTGELTGDGKDDIIAVRYYLDNNNIEHDTSYDVIDNVYSNPGFLDPKYSCNLNDGPTTSVRVVSYYASHPVYKYGNKNFVTNDFDGDSKADVLMVSNNILENLLFFNSIKINYSRKYSSNSPTYKTITYPQLPHVNGYYNDFKYINVKGNDNPSYFVSGDFDGDGAQDYILILSDNFNVTNSYKAFFSSPAKNIINQEIVGFGVGGNSSDPFYATTVATAPEIMPIDFDGDGKQEILVEKPGASYILSVYPVSPASGYNYAASVLYTFTNVLSGYRVFPGDFNGDGKTDLLVRTSATNPTASWNILYSTGKLYKSYPFYFQNRPYLENDNGTSAHHILVSDLNNDGKSDIWHSFDLSTSSSRHALYISNGVPLDNSNSTSVFSIYDYTANASINKDKTVQSVFGDFNFDGKPDIFSITGTTAKIIYPRPDKEEILMASTTNGFGAQTSFTYVKGYDRSNTYEYDNPSAPLGQGANGKPYAVLKTPLYVLNTLIEPDGANSIYKYTFMNYEDAMFHPLRGFLGFKKVTSRQGLTSSTSYSEMNTDFLVPVVNKITKDQYGTMLSETDITNNLLKINPSDPFDKRYINEVSKSKSFDYTTGAGSETDNIYDDNGNITEATSITGPFSGTTITPLETVTTTASYVSANTPTPSLPETITVTKKRNPEVSVNKTTTYSYNSIGLLGSVTDFPGTQMSTTTSYTYDIFGNIISSALTVLNPLTPVPVVNNVYDPQGKNLKSKSVSGSGITKTETYAYNTFNDNLSSQTSSDGLTTSFDYDGFGNLIKTTLPDGNKLITSLAWQQTTGTYSQTSYRYSDNGLWNKTYFDNIGREIRKESKGFEDNLISSTTRYNQYGLVYKQQQPHYNAESAVEITNIYDELQRLTSVSNGSTTTNYAYIATGGHLTTTTTNGAGQSSSKTTDASGVVIKSNDNGGQLDFTYDSWGNQKEVKFGSTSLVVNTYDSYGRQTSLVDKNAGTIAYEYNALGKLTKQTDANNNVHTLEYDAFGRLTKKIGLEGTTFYTYYSAPGKANDNISSITGFGGDTKTYLYDNLQRLISESTVLAGQPTFTKSFEYDDYSNLIKTTYPSRVSIKDTYNDNDILINTSMIYNGNSKTLFTAAAMNSRGVYTEYSYGNGKSSTVEYDLAKGIPTRYYTSGIQDLNLDFDANKGNLLSRNDVIKGLKENFTYDDLNRLSASTVNNVQQFVMTYDNTSGNSLGNIKTKSDIGNYQYDAQKINAVRFITNSGTPTNPPNVISTNLQSISYTRFLKTSTIDENGYQIAYAYGYDEQRIKSVLKQNLNLLETKYYLGSYEKQVKDATSREIHYVSAGNGLCAIIIKENGVVTPYFVYSDYLGSLLTLTNSTGTVITEQNFDAWGRHRNPANWTYNSIPARPDWLYRGFTGHEDVSQFALINMNGRMYDPVTCRMLSPDNYVPLPWNTQGYNRYGYANNNPLSYVDPDGNFIWLIIGAAALIGGIANGTAYVHNNKTFFGGFWRGAVAAGGAALTGGAIAGALPGLGGAVLGGLWGGVFSGGAGALLNKGDIVQGIIYGGLTGIVGGGVSAYFGGGTGALIGGAASGALNSALNNANVLTGALIGGGVSFGLYHGMNYYNYSRSSLKSILTYKQFAKISGDYQRSIVRRKEFGGVAFDDGSMERADAPDRHSLNNTIRYKNISGRNALLHYHTHWAKANVNYNTNGTDDIVSKSLASFVSTTSNGPSPGDQAGPAGMYKQSILIDRNYFYSYTPTSITQQPSYYFTRNNTFSLFYNLY